LDQASQFRTFIFCGSKFPNELEPLTQKEKKRTNPMAPSAIIEPDLDLDLGQKPCAASGPKQPKPSTPPSPKQPNFLDEIFNGHEKFLGLTPD